MLTYVVNRSTALDHPETGPLVSVAEALAKCMMQSRSPRLCSVGTGMESKQVRSVISEISHLVQHAVEEITIIVH
jgi:hypothetical protein